MGKLSADEIGGLVKAMKRAKLVWGAGGLTVDYRKDEERFLAGMAELPTEAKALQSAGVTRIGTWITPSSNDLPYRANFEQTGRRLREIAKVYGDHDIRFGLEYVGAKTSWSRRKYAFVHNMKQTKELIAAIDCDNVGFILDSSNWYTAHENIDDLLTLTNDDIVACDLNDATAGLAIDEQKGTTRDLPCATGVIDLKAFLKALVKIGYDGPVRAEPFLKSLSAMDDEPAVVETAAAMKKAFSLIE
jgi:sugar phosphate isomerase/epimerase